MFGACIVLNVVQSIGEFILSHANVKVKPRGKIYSINEGNERDWDEPVKEFINSKKHPPPGPDGNPAKPYSARYVGSMVADIHRTLLYGGVFCYPAGHDSPDGKVRLAAYCTALALSLTQYLHVSSFFLML